VTALVTTFQSDHCLTLQNMDMQTFYGKGPHPLLWADLWTTSGLLNHLNYRVVFVVHTQFTNMPTGCGIQRGGPCVGDPSFNTY